MGQKFNSEKMERIRDSLFSRSFFISFSSRLFCIGTKLEIDL